MSQHRCESCAMPIETGTYCQYCADESGKLQPFEERFTRMVQWMTRQKPGLSQADAERETLAYMAQMPAWKDHPKVKAAAGTTDSNSDRADASRGPRPQRTTRENT